MPLTAIEGVVENGTIRLREDVSLPEKTRMYVIIADPRPAAAASVRSPHLARREQSRDFRKQIVEVPSDAVL